MCRVKLRGAGGYVQEKGECLAGGKRQTGGEDFSGWGGTETN